MPWFGSKLLEYFHQISVKKWPRDKQRNVWWTGKRIDGRCLTSLSPLVVGCSKYMFFDEFLIQVTREFSIKILSFCLIEFFFSLSLFYFIFLCIWINSILLWFMVNVLTRTGFEWEWRVIVTYNHCEWGFFFHFHHSFLPFHFFHSTFTFICFSLDLILCTVTGIVGNEEKTWKGESKKESEVTIKPDYLCSTSGYNFFFIILLDERNPSLSSFLFFFFFCPIHFIPRFISSVLHSFFLSLSLPCPFHLS